MASYMTPFIGAMFVASAVFADPWPQWSVGAESGRGGGAVVHGRAAGQLGGGGGSLLSGFVHGKRTFGGLDDGAQSVGGGINYNHPKGLHAGLDATHHRGRGSRFTGKVGGSTRLGPGLLSLTGALTGGTGMAKPEANLGLTFSTDS